MRPSAESRSELVGMGIWKKSLVFGTASRATGEGAHQGTPAVSEGPMKDRVEFGDHVVEVISGCLVWELEPRKSTEAWI